MEPSTNTPDFASSEMTSLSRQEKEIEDVAVTKIMYLLSSQHYDVLYGMPYRGEDDRVSDLIHRCEMTGARIREASDINAVRMTVAIIDASLIQEMPPNEMRRLCRDILERDETLVNYMPQLRARLVKICRSIDLSKMFQPQVLSAIQRDVEAKKSLISGYE